MTELFTYIAPLSSKKDQLESSEVDFHQDFQMFTKESLDLQEFHSFSQLFQCFSVAVSKRVGQAGEKWVDPPPATLCLAWPSWRLPGTSIKS
jgi:chemotaxis regulatin CheY-phosphate phosphatase CheZ